MFEKIMPEKKNLFIISNAERPDQPGTHWWSISSISPVSKLLFFFYLSGAAGLKNFIVKDNKEPMNKVLKKRGKRTGQTRN